MSAESKISKRKIRVAFTDFYYGFKCSDFFIYNILNEYYDVEIDEKDPEFLFYSCFGLNFLKYEKAIKIFWTGENVHPNFNLCDYSISFLRDSVNGRNFYLPFAYVHLMEYKINIPISKGNEANRKFCSFLYSNDSLGEGARLRKEFCLELMKYKHVDCGGKVLHNYDGVADRLAQDEHQSKVAHLSEYKFNIAFENTNTLGYVTEKLTDAFLANTVPIYWGSEADIAPFPKNSIICANDFKSIQELVSYIEYVDKNDDLYYEILNNNPLRTFGQSVKLDFANFLTRIIDSGKVSSKDPLHLDPIYKLQIFALLPSKAYYWINRLAKLIHRISGK